MEEQDYETEYLKDQALIEAEKQAQLEAEWKEMDEYENQLPARIEINIEINKQKHLNLKNHENTETNTQ